jgi:hypothetical protein
MMYLLSVAGEVIYLPSRKGLALVGQGLVSDRQSRLK